MTISISLALNNNSAAIVTLDAPITVQALAVLKVGARAVVSESILNGSAVTVGTVVNHADALVLKAAEPTYLTPTSGFSGVAAQVAAPTGSPFIQILYINNDGLGFAGPITVAYGLTVGRLLEQKGVNPAGFTIRVNENIATADQTLNAGDKLSVVPAKIQGAADILFISNAGAGLAERVSVIDGITLRQFIAQKMNAQDPRNFQIRVNQQIATADQVLNHLDKVSVTPNKIQGALA
jgi:sulfur carrier protein ThiS